MSPLIMASELPHHSDADKLVRLPVSFPTPVHEWLRQRAFDRRMAMAEIVREAVREYRYRHEAIENPEDQRRVK
jgi:hypothetical protein